MVRLGVLALVGLTMTGNLPLSDKALGHEVPPQARQWVDRHAQIGDIAGKAQSGFKQISDSFR